MIDESFAQTFAKDWIESWNSHDLDIILAHYTDDFSIESPYALKWLPESKGVIKGKPAVRAYWEIGLKTIPNLKFELIEVLMAVNSITLYYINTVTGRKTAEVMFFNEEKKVTKVFAHYN